MPTYITLLTFTQQGIENIKEGPTRLDVAKQAHKDMGCEMKPRTNSRPSSQFPFTRSDCLPAGISAASFIASKKLLWR